MTSVVLREGDEPPTPDRATRPSATGKERIVALDGLRAVALLIIMGYHFGAGWLRGGFFSLDIFYVLSGYLITGLLLSEYRRRRSIKLPAFWMRRARRLLPALLIVLVAVTLMVRFAEPAGLYPGYRLDAISALFYFSNWWQIAQSSNYFVASGAVSPLTHTWSLAVEEQFYLVWPLVVLGVLHFSGTFVRGLRVLLWVSMAGVVASALEMALLYQPASNTTRLYFGTDTHAQSILVGSALACALTTIQLRRGAEGMAPPARGVAARAVLVAMGMAGLAGTLALTYTQNGSEAFDYRGGILLSALSAACIIVAAVCVPAGAVDRALSVRPLVWIGTISYGAYLWHYPIAIFLDAGRIGLGGLPLLAVRFGATITLAALSYYLVERPVIEGTFWRSPRAIAPAVALVLATVVVVVSGSVAEASTASVIVPTPAGLTSNQTTVLVAGDSTALTLGASLYYDAEASKDGLDIVDEGTEGCGVAEGADIVSNGVLRPTVAACNPRSPPADQWPAELKNELRHYRPRAVVLLAGRWEVYNRTSLAGKVTNITDPAFAQYIESQLQRFVSLVATAGSRTVLLTAPYYDSGEQPNGQPEPQDNAGRVRIFNRLVDKVAAANPTTSSLVNLNAIVSPAGRFTSSIDGVTVRTPDGVHFPYFNNYDATAPLPDTKAEVVQFARWIGPKILPSIVAATKR
jgi:peptidoglycan/LPS O-acetylase OafA/YrhL